MRDGDRMHYSTMKNIEPIVGQDMRMNEKHQDETRDDDR